MLWFRLQVVCYTVPCEVCTTFSMYHFCLFFALHRGEQKWNVPPMYKEAMKRGQPLAGLTYQIGHFQPILVELLAEVALQQALESLAVAGLVAGHLIKTCAALGFAYNFEALPCNSLITLYPALGLPEA